MPLFAKKVPENNRYQWFLTGMRFDINSGPWVAGGCARRIFDENAEYGGDIDIFFANEKQLNATYEHLCQLYPKEAKEYVRTSQSVVQISIGSVDVQLIEFRFFNSAEDLLKSFDYTICQFVTDGKHVYYTAEAAADTAKRLIRLVEGVEWKQNAHLRLRKYLQHGFEPSPGLLSYAINASMPERDYSPFSTSWY